MAATPALDTVAAAALGAIIIIIACVVHLDVAFRASSFNNNFWKREIAITAFAMIAIQLSSAIRADSY